MSSYKESQCLSCDKLNKYSLKKQMTIMFSASYGTFLFLMFIVCISIVIGTNDTVRRDSENALKDQINRSVQKVMNGKLSWFTEFLTIGKEGFLNIYGLAMRDTYY